MQKSCHIDCTIFKLGEIKYLTLVFKEKNSYATLTNFKMEVNDYKYIQVVNGLVYRPVDVQ